MADTDYIVEHRAITEVLNAYVQGAMQAKSSVMKPAFSDKATMYGVKDGKLSGGAVTETLFAAIDTVVKPNPDATAAVVSIDIVGTAASARVDSDRISGKFRYTDFFNLLKVDGRWVIVSKIFYTHPSV